MDTTALAILSGIMVSAEIVIFNFLQRKHPDASVDILAWLYRVGSIFFMSLYLIYESRQDNGIESPASVKALNLGSSIWWVILMSLVSAISIVTFFRSVAGAKHAGAPVAIRSLYIPVTFFAAVLLLTHDWGNVNWKVYAGMGIITIGIISIVLGSQHEGGIVFE